MNKLILSNPKDINLTTCNFNNNQEVWTALKDILKRHAIVRAYIFIDLDKTDENKICFFMALVKKENIINRELSSFLFQEILQIFPENAKFEMIDITNNIEIEKKLENIGESFY